MNDLIELHDESDNMISDINQFIDNQPKEFLFTDIHTLLLKIVLFNHKAQSKLTDFMFENSDVV